VDTANVALFIALIISLLFIWIWALLALLVMRLPNE